MSDRHDRSVLTKEKEAKSIFEDIDKNERVVDRQEVCSVLIDREDSAIDQLPVVLSARLNKRIIPVTSITQLVRY